MVRFLNSVILVFVSSQLFAQTNTGAATNVNNEAVKNSKNVEQNSISSPSLDVRSAGYFKTESDNFETLVKEKPQSAQAWLNYYKSTLYSYFNGSSKLLTASQKEELNEIVDEMKRQIPTSFEYNLAVYINGQHNTELYPYLLKAEELKPNDIDVLEQLTAYYAIKNNDSKCKAYAEKFKRISLYENFFDEYAYNLLKSTNGKGVLFTHGIMDTYPLYEVMQSNPSFNNLKIINIDYLNSKEFRMDIESRLGISLNFNGNIYTYAFELAQKLNSTQSVFFSNAFAKNELKKNIDKLELSGLCFKYNDGGVNITQIDNLWRNEFKKNNFSKGNMKDDYARKMAANYQPALLALYNYYKNNGNTEEADKVKSTAKKIATLNGNEKQLAELMK